MYKYCIWLVLTPLRLQVVFHNCSFTDNIEFECLIYVHSTIIDYGLPDNLLYDVNALETEVNSPGQYNI